MDAVMNCDFGEQFSESALLRWVQAAKETRVIRIRNGREDREIAASFTGERELSRPAVSLLRRCLNPGLGLKFVNDL
jgi:hypothetical protein